NTKWLEQFAGEYEVNRYAHSDLTMIASLFGRVTISVKDSTRLAITSPQETLYYVPIDSTTFREEFKNDRIAFERDENGKVLRMYNGLLAIIAFDKISAVQSATLHYLIFGLVFMLGLVTLTYWPLVAIIRRHYVLGPRARPPMPPISKVIAWTNYLLYFLFWVGLIVSLANPEELVFGIPLALKISLVFPLIMIVTTLGMILMAVILVGHKRYRLRGRIFYIVLCLASILALWQLNYWNLLGFYY
ncbi:MAG: hypothetical protein OEU76_09060, partial [Cyclobacteriaceae bacterium]|nr:hypothetical protein [Cyclobacteriaceae bacterium]